MNEFERHLSRRSFLRWAALIGTGSIIGWRFLGAAKGLEFSGLKNLTRNQARILAAAYSAITEDEDRASIHRAIHFMDNFLSPLSKRDQTEFKTGLILLEQTPIFFNAYPRRFTALSREQQKRCLDGWRTGAVWRRPLFCALKELSYLALYTRPETWKEIGYGGPLVPNDGAWLSYESRYKGLTAP